MRKKITVIITMVPMSASEVNARSPTTKRMPTASGDLTPHIPVSHTHTKLETMCQNTAHPGTPAVTWDPSTGAIGRTPIRREAKAHKCRHVPF